MQNKQDAEEFLKRAEKLLKDSPQTELESRIILFHGLKFPGTFKPKQIEKAITIINRACTFDPFWLWYANELLHLNLAVGVEFIKKHRKATSANLLASVRRTMPELVENLKEIFSSEPLRQQAIHISEKETKILSHKQTHAWKASIRNHITFNFLAETITSGNKELKIQSDSYSMKILQQLIKNGFMPYSNLYSNVWNIEYDPDWDEPTLKAAVYRLRQRLKPFQGLILLVPQIKNNQRGLELKISGRWEALL
jgi:hypothetical protein